MPSRGACAPPPLSSPLYVPLPSLEFFVTLHSLTPLLSCSPNLFLPIGLARVFHVDDHPPSTVKTSHFTKTTPDAGKHVLHPPSYLIPLISARAFARASAILLRVSHLCQMEIAREKLAGSHVDEIFAYSPGNSRIVCFDVHIYLTGIRSRSASQSCSCDGDSLVARKLHRDNDLILRERISHFRS